MLPNCDMLWLSNRPGFLLAAVNRNAIFISPSRMAGCFLRTPMQIANGPTVAILQRMNPRIRHILTLALLLALTTPSWAQTPIVVSVELQNGRRYEGVIDAQSTPQQLVLRIERGAAFLCRPIPWKEIHSAQLGKQPIEVAELLKTYPARATAAKPWAERSKANPEPNSPSDRPATKRPAEVKPPMPPTKVISIACDALLANWDADVETDGLVIHLQPMDAWQQLIAATGTLEVEMYTLQARTFQHASQSRGRSVEPFLRWTQAVNLNAYSARGAYVQLPFQAAHPEFDDSLGAYGLVHIKFSVPGSGVFEQTIDGVRIRPWSPIRDYLQMDTGYRFLPHEGTGRGKNSWFTDDQ